jgi:hypothetical protein
MESAEWLKQPRGCLCSELTPKKKTNKKNLFVLAPKQIVSQPKNKGTWVFIWKLALFTGGEPAGKDSISPALPAFPACAQGRNWQAEKAFRCWQLEVGLACPTVVKSKDPGQHTTQSANGECDSAGAGVLITGHSTKDTAQKLPNLYQCTS